MTAALLAPRLALAQTYTLTTLAAFTGTNGYNPYSEPLLDSSGNLFGTTNGGGDLSQRFGQGDGTVYEIAAGTKTLTTIATFEGSNGVDPDGDLIMDSKGNLYGTTDAYGSISHGTVFEIAAGSGTVTTLATFTGDNGANPEADLTFDSSGNLYGTTTEGGASGDGTVFKIASGSGGIGTGALTTLYSFSGIDGVDPYGNLTLDGSGNLFGSTVAGGASNDGTVFEIASGSGGIGTGGLTTLYTFDGTNGAYPFGLALDSRGDLYSATSGGGANFGTVFELSPAASGAASAPEPATILIMMPGFAALGLIVAARRGRFS